MNAQSIQLRKEIRPLLLPWTLTMLAGFFSLLPISRTDWSWSPIDLFGWVLPLGCFLVIPLLAALPLGIEFQQGTFTLLLAQPVERQELWRQKIIITLAAVLPPAILYLFSLSRNGDLDADFGLAAVWIVASTAGSIAGTLIARSAIGGLALSGAFFGILFVFWSRLAESQRHHGGISTSLLWITAIFLFCYAVGMVLLGRRMFLRFEATGGGQANLGAIPGVGFLPQIATRWLRSGTRSSILNLIRREFHLLRTVWLLSLFSFFIWIGLVLLGLVRPNETERAPLPAGLAVILSLVIALLAGSLSMGEEKNWGTHAWQLTLPLSASTQWLIKLAFALCASVLCAVGIPLAVLITRGWISGALFSYLDHTPLWVWFAEALVATFLAFWCSCVFKGTVRAVLYVFPVLLSLGLTSWLANWVGLRVAEHSDWLLNAVVNKYDPFRLNHSIAVFVNRADDLPGVFAVTISPLLAVGLIQSLRLFGMQLDNRRFHVLRSVLPPLATVFLSFFVLTFFLEFAYRLQTQEQDVLHESNLAIQRLETSRKDVRELQRFGIEDLAKSYPLSDRTRRWLGNAMILVTVKDPRGGAVPPRIQWPYEYGFTDRAAPGKSVLPYSATIRTARGSQCNLNFRAASENEWGLLTYACE